MPFSLLSVIFLSPLVVSLIKSLLFQGCLEYQLMLKDIQTSFRWPPYGSGLQFFLMCCLVNVVQWILNHHKNNIMESKQYNTIQYNTMQAMQCNAKQCNTMQHNAMQCNTTQHNITLYNTTQHNTIQYNTIQYNITQHNTIQYILQITFTIWL